jgi:hypothetical protein
MLQVAALQQQQQEQDVASRIELLEKKKDEITKESSEREGEVISTAPNLFAGFAASHRLPL